MNLSTIDSAIVNSMLMHLTLGKRKITSLGVAILSVADHLLGPSELHAQYLSDSLLLSWILSTECPQVSLTPCVLQEPPSGF